MIDMDWYAPGSTDQVPGERERERERRRGKRRVEEEGERVHIKEVRRAKGQEAGIERREGAGGILPYPGDIVIFSLPRRVTSVKSFSRDCLPFSARNAVTIRWNTWKPHGRPTRVAHILEMHHFLLASPSRPSLPT